MVIDKSIEVTLQWVPSHIGIEGNKRVDKAAKEVVKNPLIFKIKSYNSFNYITRKIKA